MEDLVSIIIPIKNSERLLDRCLSSVTKQTYSNYELIVVDDNSGKKSFQLENAVIKKYPKIKLFKNKKNGRTSARNFGIKKAKGMYIFFLDSDQELSKNVIKECVNSKKDMVNIPEEIIGDTLIIKFANYENKINFDNTNRDIPRFYKKKIFGKIGLLDEGLVFGEDWDLKVRALNANYKDGHIESKINHYENITILKTIKKYYFYGKTARSLFKKHKSKAAKMYSGINNRVLFNMVKYFFANPFLFFGALFYKSVRYLSAVVGYVSA